MATHRTIRRTTFARKVSVSIHRLAALSAVPALLALLALPPIPAAAQRATVFGTVYGEPLVGARVQMGSSDLHGTVLDVITDSRGRFRIDRVRPSQYIVGFTHPFLDSLGLEVPLRTVSVGDPTVAIGTDLQGA